jgi:hypothetical protein
LYYKLKRPNGHKFALMLFYNNVWIEKIRIKSLCMLRNNVNFLPHK